MIFEVTSEVTLRLSQVRTSNFASKRACDGLGIERVRIVDVFDDVGIGARLANKLTSSLRRAAGDQGIRAITPGVYPKDRDSLVFEIVPLEVATRAVE